MAGMYFIPTPASCDFCNKTFPRAQGTEMYDSKTVSGPWGCLCASCKLLVGVPGVGQGIAQRYVRGEDGKFYYQEG